LEAAHSIFATKSIDRVSIDEIANEVGISKGSFYNYFGDRDALAFAVWEKIQFDLEHQISELNAGIDDASRRITRALCFLIKDATGKPKRMKALMAISERDSSIDTPLNFGAVSDIKNGIKSGKFKNLDLETGLLVIDGMMTAGIKYAAESEMTLKELYETSTKVGAAILRALGVTQVAAHKAAEKSARDVFLSGFDVIATS